MIEIVSFRTIDEPKNFLVHFSQVVSPNERAKFIRCPDDLEKIPESSEREFARLVLEKNPDLEIIHEPVLFQHELGEGDKKALRGTLPDFYIYNPRNSTRDSGDEGIYVELTTSSRFGNNPEHAKRHHDPKHKQRLVIEGQSPKPRYVVLYRENLEKIQEVHEVEIFCAKKDSAA